MYRSKGTKYSIQQFFRTFFGIDPDVVYTKKQIFTLNESEVGPSSQRFLTDDKLYQTYAIQIKSELSINEWREIYKLFVHPAGMYLGSQVQLQGVVDIDFEIQPPPGLLDIPPQEVESIANVRHPLGIADHTALFDIPLSGLGGDEMKFRMSMGSKGTYPNPAGNDIKDVEDVSISELQGLHSNLLEFLRPDSPTFDEDDDDSGSAMGLSALETLDQDRFTWVNKRREDGDNTAVGVTGDSDSEITLNELL